jgi:hypothetical protein
MFDNTNKATIYRYKFSDNFIEELFRFSKIHQYDERKDFKEAWNTWRNNNNSIIEDEIKRLLELNYHGDIMDKMYKSARYYFRKKGTEKKEPTKRCAYVGLLKELLDSMDNHIKSNIDKKEYKPSEGFSDFCKENIELLKKEIERLISYNIKDSLQIKNKIKKTYKNRYFMIINN